MNKKIFLLILVVLLGFGAGVNVAEGQSVVAEMYGWAWSATNEAPWFGAGWFKFNNCDDNDQNGEPDPGSCIGPTFKVSVDLETGEISGHAWSSNVGWVSFNRAETGNPPCTNPPQCTQFDDPGNGSGPIAKLDLSNPNSSSYGRAIGWGRVLAGKDFADGWDGWIHLTDNSAPNSKHPGGKNYTSGSKGITYNPAAGAIVGNAWGGPVIGWLKFLTVTFGAPTGTFNYNLSNSGDIELTRGGPPVFVTITRNHLSGIAEPVTISIPSPLPGNSGITTIISSDNNPCIPTCASLISFQASANAPYKDYDVEVKGVSGPSNLAKFTEFEVEVKKGGPGQIIPPGGCIGSNCGSGTLNIICSVVTSPPFGPPYLVNKAVMWQATKSGVGTAPYVVVWTFTNIPSADITAQTSGTGPDFTKEIVYSKVGPKTAKATVTDSSVPPKTGVCAETAPINVLLSSTIKEN